jgi:hypothetical protein
MIPWIIQITTISLILIILIHYLYSFFMINLTIPKVKDLVNKPQQQYDILYNITKEEPNIEDKSYESENMKNELKNYLKELNHKNVNNNSVDTTTNNNHDNNPINNSNNNPNNGFVSDDNIFSSNSYSSF